MAARLVRSDCICVYGEDYARYCCMYLRFHMIPSVYSGVYASSMPSHYNGNSGSTNYVSDNIGEVAAVQLENVSKSVAVFDSVEPIDILLHQHRPTIRLKIVKTSTRKWKSIIDVPVYVAHSLFPLSEVPIHTQSKHD